MTPKWRQFNVAEDCLALWVWHDGKVQLATRIHSDHQWATPPDGKFLSSHDIGLCVDIGGPPLPPFPGLAQSEWSEKMNDLTALKNTISNLSDDVNIIARRLRALENRDD